MAKLHWIRTVYLYIFSVVGVVLLIIGSVSFLDMALKAWVFTQAEENERLEYRRPYAPFAAEKVEEIAEGEELTENEREQARQWLVDYASWQKQRDAVDPVTANRHRTAARNLAMILVGAPLYWYHWRTIKKEGAGFR